MVDAGDVSCVHVVSTYRIVPPVDQHAATAPPPAVADEEPWPDHAGDGGRLMTAFDHER